MSSQKTSKNKTVRLDCVSKLSLLQSVMKKDLYVYQPNSFSSKCYNNFKTSYLIIDMDTVHHMLRVSAYTEQFILILDRYKKIKDMDAKDKNNLARYSLLHDIGKIYIDQKILSKKNKLTDREYAHIKKHPIIGERLIDKCEKNGSLDKNELEVAKILTKNHHERWDGSGYPNGLKEEEIPLPSRILTIIDIYDALTNARRYKAPINHKKTIKIMQEEKNFFDPDLFKSFISPSSQKIIEIMKHSLTKEIKQVSFRNHYLLENPGL